MAVQIIDPFETKDNKNIIDPFKDEEKKKKPKTPVEEAFGDLSISEIIEGKKKGDIKQPKITDPFQEPTFKITGEQLKSIWEEPLGISKENKEKLKFILGDENTLLGKANRYLVDTSSKVIDTAVRGASSLGMIVSGVAGDVTNGVYKWLDKDPGGAGERLTRDINGILIGVMGESGGFTSVPKRPGAIKSLKTGEIITDVREYAKSSVEKNAEVKNTVKNIIDKEVDNIKKNDTIIGDTFTKSDDVKQTLILDEINATKQTKTEPVTIDTPETIQRSPALQIETVKKITDAATKFFVEEGIKVDSKKPISLQIQEILLSDKYDTPTIIRRIAEDNKIPIEDFINTIFPSVSQSAKEMNLYSQVAKYLRNKLDPTGEIFNQTGSPVFNIFKRFDNVRRALLVTRLATSVRNYISQTARISLDSLQNIVDFGLQKIIEPFVDPIQFAKNKVSPIANLKQLMLNFRQWKPSEFQKVKEQTNLLLSNTPSESNRLFLRYSSDVVNAAKNKGKSGGKVEKVLSNIESAADTLNIVNKTQEFITRRAVFQARLDEIIRANKDFYGGKTLEQLIKDGEHTKIRPSDIANAVDKSLEVTFAKDYNLGKGGYDALASRVINTINKLPFVLTSIIPFPRFLMNSLQFHLEFNPLGVLRFLSKEQRVKLSKGDTSGLSKAVLGTGMLLAALSLRKQPYAGEKWYEFKVGDRTIDTRPFNPFAAYLFVADVIERYKSGTLRNIDLKDIVTVFAGIRGTTGLYLFDQMVDWLTNTDVKSGDPVWWEGFKKFTGELLAGYLTPLQNVTDAVGQFFPEMAITKETGGRPFIGAFEKRLGGADLLPNTSPTYAIIDKAGVPRARPYQKEDPLLTQVTGLGFAQPKNSAEKEFDKLQILPREIYQSTKIPELDKAYKDLLAPKIHYGISKLVETQAYQNLPFNTKVVMIKNALSAAKAEAKKQLQQDVSLVPYLLQYKLNQFSKDERRVINDVIGIDYLNTIINNIKKGTKK